MPWTLASLRPVVHLLDPSQLPHKATLLGSHPHELLKTILSAGEGDKKKGDKRWETNKIRVSNHKEPKSEFLNLTEMGSQL